MEELAESDWSVVLQKKEREDQGEVYSSVLCRIKMLPVVGHVHDLRETLRVRAATANVALTLMKYRHAYII